MKQTTTETTIAYTQKVTTTEYLKAKEVAELLGVHRNTVYKYIRKGEFPNKKLDSSNQYLIPYSDVVAYCERHNKVMHNINL